MEFGFYGSVRLTILFRIVFRIVCFTCAVHVLPVDDRGQASYLATKRFGDARL